MAQAEVLMRVLAHHLFSRDTVTIKVGKKIISGVKIVKIEAIGDELNVHYDSETYVHYDSERQFGHFKLDESVSNVWTQDSYLKFVDSKKEGK